MNLPYPQLPSPSDMLSIYFNYPLHRYVMIPGPLVTVHSIFVFTFFNISFRP
jgi:hypothetical protein